MINTLSAEDVLDKKGFLAETVIGTSMCPLLKEHRDTVIIKKITAPLKKYDVVLFKRGKQLVLHRIIKISNGLFLIRGDNCVQSEVVYDKQILGIMTHFCRKGKQCDVQHKGYRVYSVLWVRCFWIRVTYRKVMGLFKKIKRRHNEKIQK